MPVGLSPHRRGQVFARIRVQPVRPYTGVIMERFAISRRLTASVSMYVLLGAGVTGLGVASVAGLSALAQDRGPVQRIVHGKVENKDGSGVKGAVVYLQDSKTSSVKTAIADDDGSYRFVQLTQNTDYELWAKSNGKRSKNKEISSFDSKNDLLMNLTIE
jgi:hypothetical protein